MTKYTEAVSVVEGFAILLLMQTLGEIISRSMHLPLPGNLVGLLLLFFSLQFKIIKLEMVEGAVNLLLDNMMLLFIPLNVGLMTIWPLIKKEWLAILGALLFSTVVVLVVTGKTMDLFMGKGGQENDQLSS